MTSLEILLTVVATMTAGSAMVLAIILMHRTLKRQEQAIKDRVWNADQEHEEPPTPPTPPTIYEGLTAEEAIKILEKDYPPGFETTYFGKTVIIAGCRVVPHGPMLVMSVIMTWWDECRHLKKGEVFSTNLKWLRKALEPKTHYVGVDPAPIDDEEG